jgi:hypothetical protein
MSKTPNNIAGETVTLKLEIEWIKFQLTLVYADTVCFLQYMDIYIYIDLGAVHILALHVLYERLNPVWHINHAL